LSLYNAPMNPKSKIIYHRPHHHPLPPPKTNLHHLHHLSLNPHSIPHSPQYQQTTYPHNSISGPQSLQPRNAHTAPRGQEIWLNQMGYGRGGSTRHRGSRSRFCRRSKPFYCSRRIFGLRRHRWGKRSGELIRNSGMEIPYERGELRGTDSGKYVRYKREVGGGVGRVQYYLGDNLCLRFRLPRQ
jgi:hypothetical protein